MSIVETAKSVEGLKQTSFHTWAKGLVAEEITRQTKGVALSSKKAAYTSSVPSKKRDYAVSRSAVSKSTAKKGQQQN